MNEKPPNHPDYEIAPGMFNFSKWSRENIPKPPPKFKLGDAVRLTMTLYVAVVGQDCDGTSLYGLATDEYAHLDPEPHRYACLHGISDDSLEPAPKESE